MSQYLLDTNICIFLMRGESTALSHSLTLVTRNGRHFADVAGLVVEDWLAGAIEVAE